MLPTKRETLLFKTSSKFLLQWFYNKNRIGQHSIPTQFLIKWLPTRQIYVRRTFVEHSHDIFLEYSERFPMKFRGILPNNVRGNLNRKLCVFEILIFSGKRNRQSYNNVRTTVLFLTIQCYYTESSKAFERKPFRVLRIIKNHWSFKNTHKSLLSEPLQVAFIKNHRLKTSLRYVRFTKLCRMSKPI